VHGRSAQVRGAELLPAYADRPDVARARAGDRLPRARRADGTLVRVRVPRPLQAGSPAEPEDRGRRRRDGRGPAPQHLHRRPAGRGGTARPDHSRSDAPPLRGRRHQRLRDPPLAARPPPAGLLAHQPGPRSPGPRAELPGTRRPAGDLQRVRVEDPRRLPLRTRPHADPEHLLRAGPQLPVCPANDQSVGGDARSTRAQRIGRSPFRTRSPGRLRPLGCRGGRFDLQPSARPQPARLHSPSRGRRIHPARHGTGVLQHRPRRHPRPQRPGGVRPEVRRVHLFQRLRPRRPDLEAGRAPGRPPREGRQPSAAWVLRNRAGQRVGPGQPLQAADRRPVAAEPAHPRDAPVLPDPPAQHAHFAAAPQPAAQARPGPPPASQRSQMPLPDRGRAGADGGRAVSDQPTGQRRDLRPRHARPGQQEAADAPAVLRDLPPPQYGGGRFAPARADRAPRRAVRAAVQVPPPLAAPELRTHRHGPQGPAAPPPPPPLPQQTRPAGPTDRSRGLCARVPWVAAGGCAVVLSA